MKFRIVATIILILAAFALGTIPAAAQQIACDFQYIVQPGDTLSEIAERCGTTVPQLVDANPAITDPARIEVGQVLLLSGNTPNSVALYPMTGGPGTAVTVIVNGMPIEEPVRVTFGPLNGPQAIDRTVTTDRTGALIDTFTIPRNTTIQAPRWQLIARATERGTQVASLTFLFQPGEVASDAPLFTETNIYLIDTSVATAQCAQPAVPVAVTFPPTVAPLTAALETMFANQDPTLPGTNLRNEFYASDLTIQDINITDGLATISLGGSVLTTSVCTAQYMPRQIRETALQFSTVSAVEIFVNGVRIEELLGG